ncbi:MAG: hypothetical protein A2381_01630 [Bdellovibrionales bacterium RIFOXYB1_FULL_37_110]|nr:MAG: hypothetical protein A2417_15885 [Bdellovibrionales bacterium RIFOXYC1_FULL_37_79]OFZ58916.1 MAG: hypothetical protein A2381_01630 [Bdellovibrionales bacterium RIFOXYB1_FULL_37_110]OFZ64638.1 MAG: hypothetical protein A2577_13305 [Bdellovibrionales bacterium RIFOXYD1_FULL_36_51]
MKKHAIIILFSFLSTLSAWATENVDTTYAPNNKKMLVVQASGEYEGLSTVYLHLLDAGIQPLTIDMPSFINLSYIVIPRPQDDVRWYSVNVPVVNMEDFCGSKKYTAHILGPDDRPELEIVLTDHTFRMCYDDVKNNWKATVKKYGMYGTLVGVMVLVSDEEIPMPTPIPFN